MFYIDSRAYFQLKLIYWFISAFLLVGGYLCLFYFVSATSAYIWVLKTDQSVIDKIFKPHLMVEEEEGDAEFTVKRMRSNTPINTDLIK